MVDILKFQLSVLPVLEGEPCIVFSDGTIVLQEESLGEFLRVCETLGFDVDGQLLIISI